MDPLFRSRAPGTADLSSFTVRGQDGHQVPLLAMVDVSSEPTSSQITRTNRQTTMPEARKAVENALKSASFPPGYSYSFESPQFFDEGAMAKADGVQEEISRTSR